MSGNSDSSDPTSRLKIRYSHQPSQSSTYRQRPKRGSQILPMSGMGDPVGQADEPGIVDQPEDQQDDSTRTVRAAQRAAGIGLLCLGRRSGEHREGQAPQPAQPAPRALR